MDIIKFKNKDYQIIEKYNNNKLHVKYKNKEFVIVPFANQETLNIYIKRKKLLKKNKVEMSKLLKVDKKSLLVLEQFIDGISVISLLASNCFNESDQEELFRVYRNNRFAKIYLNYKPHNFIKHGKYFYYLSSEVYPKEAGLAFELGDDILLWMNTNEQKKYIENKGYEYAPRKIINEGAELKKAIALFCVKYW